VVDYRNISSIRILYGFLFMSNGQLERPSDQKQKKYNNWKVNHV
jgi:hypothetical protein